MKLKSILIKSCLIVSYTLLLTGCYDMSETDKRAYVVGIGLDKAEEEGSIKVTYLIANPEVGSQQSGGNANEPPLEVISFDANDFMVSRNIANAVIAKEITYDILNVLLVSEELARDKDFIRWMYQATKDREIRRDIYFVVTRESAFEYIQSNNPKLETRPHKYFELIIQRGIQTSLIPNSDLNRYFKITEADADLFLSILTSLQKDQEQLNRKKDDEFIAGDIRFEGETSKTQFIGSAVFKQGKMVGTLTGEETRFSFLLNQANGKSSDMLTTFPIPDNETYRLTARLQKRKNIKMKMDLKNKKPKIDVTLPLKVEILSDPLMVSYPKDKEKLEELRLFLEDRIESKMENLVKKTQEEFGTDPFGWSLYARKEFLTLKQWEEFDWMKSYPDMEINIHVDIRFGPFGRQGKLPSLDAIRD